MTTRAPAAKKAGPKKSGSPVAKLISELAPNIKQAKVRLKKAQKGTLALRKHHWPSVTEDQLWIRHGKAGFTTIPRTLPLFIEIIDAASKQVTAGKSVPAGKTYLVLWSRVFDEGLVKIEVEAAAAREAGYVGERNITTWRQHLKVLADLGFIDIKEGAAGPCQFVLLFNPYHAAKKLYAKGWVQKATYDSLFQRAIEIGATDLEDEETV
ncbi:hypothetical protein WK73_04435 [Burkholderia ubonensis]|uniref:hypothetical protein n=1 Tax=Burkholderia ubonensis TaxID=101571 RepID=UPI00075D36EA|nr:hypothetical protein [Burkholderia ubonensis]KVU80048.1 hypothetical protein WK73_04435 [Burkholderia ubonensis]KWC67471.1 hypothetical protein WL53_06045 [Burkholderia ubonensis]